MSFVRIESEDEVASIRLAGPEEATGGCRNVVRADAHDVPRGRNDHGPHLAGEIAGTQTRRESEEHRVLVQRRRLVRRTEDQVEESMDGTVVACRHEDIREVERVAGPLPEFKPLVVVALEEVVDLLVGATFH